MSTVLAVVVLVAFGLATSFVLGAPAAQPEGASYLRVEQEPPVVVSKELVDALLTASDIYRDRAVVPYLATELARFEVTRPGGGFVLDRIDDASFKVAPSGLLASRSAVERLWASLAEMRAEAFPKDQDADRLTAQPVVTIKMTPKDASKPAAELVIGEACPGHPADLVVLRRAPTRASACAPKDIVTALLAEPAALVEKHPFTLRMDEIEELRLERSARAADAGADAAPSGAAPGAPPIAVELARKGTGFHARAPFDRDLTAPEADAAGDLLTRIAAAEAKTVTPGGGAAFVVTGRALVRTAEHEEIVELGTTPGSDRVSLRRVKDDARLEVEPSVLRRLVPRGTTLRPRALLDAEGRRVNRVLLRCGTEQELVDRGEGFRLVSPAGFEADGALSQLVDAITRGKVDAWVADADDGSFGFTPSGCHVVLAFEGGNAPATLWFGADGEGGTYARIEHGEATAAVMVLPRSVRELAGRIYVSRGYLRTEASRIERVRVTLDGKPLPARDPAALRDAVAALYAERVLSVRDRVQPAAGAADLAIEMTLAEGGVTRRVTCRRGRDKDGAWICGIDGVAAAFEVAASRLAPFLPPVEAGP